MVRIIRRQRTQRHRKLKRNHESHGRCTLDSKSERKRTRESKGNIDTRHAIKHVSVRVIVSVNVITIVSVILSVHVNVRAI